MKRTLPTLLLLALLALSLRPSEGLAGAGTWTSAGPTGGDVHDVVLDLANPGTVYAVASNRVYKSTNGGLVWTALTIAPHSPGFVILRMDPNDSDHLLVSTAARLYRSTDAGATWQLVSGGLPVPGEVYDVTFDPHVPGALWLSSGGSLYRSVDNGQNWAALPAVGLPDYIYQLHADPHVTGRLLVLGADETTGGQVVRSTDGGLTWSASTLSGLPSFWLSGFGSRTAAFTATPGTVLLAVSANQFFRSTDGGSTFDAMALTGLARPGNIQRVVAHPGDPNQWWLGTQHGLARTTDGGLNYTEIGAGIQPVAGGYSNGVHALAFDPANPTALYAGATFTGFFVSPDGGATWLRRNDGLRQAAIRAVAVHPSQPQWLYAGYGDAFNTPSDGLFRSVDRGSSWFTASPTLEASGLRSLFVDPNTAGNPFTTTVYASGYGQALFALDGDVRDGNAGVFKSTDGGTTWSTIDNGIPTYTLSGPNGPYSQSYFVTARSVVGDPSSGGAPGGTGPLQTLYLSGSGRITYDFVTGTPTVRAARIYKSTDAGASWTAADTGLPIPTWSLTNNHAHSVQASQIVIDPANPNTLYVGTFSTVPGSGGDIPEPLTSQGVVNGVFKSTDAGATWVHSSNGLPPLQPGNPDSPHRSVLALALARSQPSTLYAAVNRDFFDSRIYKSTDAGASWSEASTGIAPDADIRVVLVDPSDADVVYAGSTGSETNPGGVYRSIDGGATWTSYSIGLPSSAALALDLDVSGSVPRLYAGTRNGVYEIDQVPDEDADGVPNTIEAGAPNGGDGNGDGIPDTVQEQVASLRGAGDAARGGDAYLTAELQAQSGACVRLENTHTLDMQQFPVDPGNDYPFGLIRLDINDCQQALLHLTWRGEVPDNGLVFRVYAPLTPDQPYSYAWRNFPVTRDGATWTVQLTDNALGDLRAANNAILFQGGVARSEAIFANGFE